MCIRDRFSGKLKLLDLTIPLRGKFDPAGRAIFTTTIKGQSISVDLTYGVVNGVPAITGNIAGDGWSLPIDAGAVGKLADASLSGRYTVVLHPDPDAPATTPQGDGYAIAQVNRTGATTFVGQLADGTSFTASGQLMLDGTLPVFIAPYKKSGVFAGSLAFLSTGDVEGQHRAVVPHLALG